MNLELTARPADESDRTVCDWVDDEREAMHSPTRTDDDADARRQSLLALGRMAMELAHELRSPLGSIRLHADLLADDLKQTDHAAVVERIQVGVATLEATIAGVLQFADSRPAATRPVDLSALVRETCDFVDLSCAMAGLTLERDVDDDVIVPGTPESLRQVVLNLLTNAIAACQPGGRVEIHLTHHAGGCRLTCRDDGKGIAPDDLPHIFEPFFSRSSGGHGLGLPIALRIVERHRGAIDVDSTPGRGTRMRVELPGFEERS